MSSGPNSLSPWSPASQKQWLQCQEEIVGKLQGAGEGHRRLETEAFPLQISMGMQVVRTVAVQPPLLDYVCLPTTKGHVVFFTSGQSKGHGSASRADRSDAVNLAASPSSRASSRGVAPSTLVNGAVPRTPDAKEGEEAENEGAFPLYAYNVVAAGADIRQSILRVKMPLSLLHYLPIYNSLIGYSPKDSTVRFFTQITGELNEIFSVPTHGKINCFAYDKDNEEILAGSSGIVYRWKLRMEDFSALAKDERLVHFEKRTLMTPEKPIEFDTKRENVIALKLNRKSRQLIVVCPNGMFVVNLATKIRTHTLVNKHEKELTCVASHRSKDLLLTGARDCYIRVWNTNTFLLVHLFRGHRGAITGLATMKSLPLLVSTSDDGCVILWRLDTLQMVQKLNAGTPLTRVTLIGDQYFLVGSSSEVLFVSLNQICSFLTSVRSRILRMRSMEFGEHPTRVMVAPEDGTLRMISNVSGQCVTKVAPMPNQQVMVHSVCDRVNNRIYTVLISGEVLVFDSNPNPCRAHEVLMPNAKEESATCLAVTNLDNAFGLQETNESDVLIFAGHKNGQVTLLMANSVHMEGPCQAHMAPVVCLEISKGRRVENPGGLGTIDYILTTGLDDMLKVFLIQRHPSNPKVIKMIAVKTLKGITCPRHIAMMGSIICLANPRSHVVSIHKLYERPGDNPDFVDVENFTHDSENDHKDEVTAMDCNSQLGLFITSAKDGAIKVWDRKNVMIRHLQFDATLSCVCFATWRGDLFVAYLGHVFCMGIKDYLPPTFLERVVMYEYEDEPKEDPIPFDERFSVRVDTKTIPTYPISLKARWEEAEKKLLEEEHRRKQLEERRRLEALGVAHLLRKMEKKEERKERKHRREEVEEGNKEEAEEESGDEDDEDDDDSDESDEEASETGIPGREGDSGSESGYEEDGEDEEFEETVARERNGKEGAQVEETEKQDEKKNEKENEKEMMEEKKEEEEDVKLVLIAKDGYIPNSVYRDLFFPKTVEIVQPELIETESSWQIPAHLLNAEFSDFLAASSGLSNPTGANPGYSQTLPRVSLLPMGPDGKPLSQNPSSPSNGSRSKDSAQSGALPLRLASDSEPEEVDLDDEADEILNKELFGNVQRPAGSQTGSAKSGVRPSPTETNSASGKVSLGSAKSHSSEKSSKSGKAAVSGVQVMSRMIRFSKNDATANGASEGLTIQESNTGQQAQMYGETSAGGATGAGPTEEELAELPAVMQRLYAEPWFPKSVSMELPIVLSILLRYLDLDPNVKRHESIMEYVVEISKEFHIDEDIMTRTCSLLIPLLDCDRFGNTISCQAARTLGALGMDSREVIKGLSHHLLSQKETMRKEAMDNLLHLTGIKTQDFLIAMFFRAGLLKPFDVVEDEVLDEIQNKKEAFPAVDKHVPQVKTWINDRSDKNKCFHDLFTTDLEIETEDDDAATVREKLMKRYNSDVVGPPGSSVITRIERILALKRKRNILNTWQTDVEKSSSILARVSRQLTKKNQRKKKKREEREEKARKQRSSVRFGGTMPATTEESEDSDVSEERARRAEGAFGGSMRGKGFSEDYQSDFEAQKPEDKSRIKERKQPPKEFRNRMMTLFSAEKQRRCAVPSTSSASVSLPVQLPDVNKRVEGNPNDSGLDQPSPLEATPTSDNHASLHAHHPNHVSSPTPSSGLIPATPTAMSPSKAWAGRRIRSNRNEDSSPARSAPGLRELLARASADCRACSQRRAETATPASHSSLEWEAERGSRLKSAGAGGKYVKTPPFSFSRSVGMVALNTLDGDTGNISMKHPDSSDVKYHLTVSTSSRSTPGPRQEASSLARNSNTTTTTTTTAAKREKGSESAEDYHAIVRHLREKRLSRELAEAEVQRELLRRKSAQRGQQMSAVLTVAEQRAKQKAGYYRRVGSATSSTRDSDAAQSMIDAARPVTVARLKDFVPVFPNEAFTVRPYAGATAPPYPTQLWQMNLEDFDFGSSDRAVSSNDDDEDDEEEEEEEEDEDVVDLLSERRSSVRSRRRVGIGSVAAASAASAAASTDWKALFKRPSALERRRMFNVNQEFLIHGGRMEGGSQFSHSLPPLRYLRDNVQMRQGALGQRLVHTLVVGRQRETVTAATIDASLRLKSGLRPRRSRGARDKQSQVDDRSWRSVTRVHPLPGKLNVATREGGSTRYGIFCMKWTTLVPDVGASVGATRAATVDDAGDISGLERVSPKLTSRSVQTEIPPDGFSLPDVDNLMPPVYLESETDTVTSQSATNKEKRRRDDDGGEIFVWDRPLPPPPPKMDSYAEPALSKRERARYIDFYTTTHEKRRVIASQQRQRIKGIYNIHATVSVPPTGRHNTPMSRKSQLR